MTIHSKLETDDDNFTGMEVCNHNSLPVNLFIDFRIDWYSLKGVGERHRDRDFKVEQH